jgi:hypothetical protein
VKEVCGLQAQVLPAAQLAVAVRSSGLILADVEQARLHERSIIWTWGLRGTLHLMATSDLGWLLLPLVGPVFTEGPLRVAGDRARSRQLGLDEDTAVRGVRLLGELLASQGPLTCQEIAVQLAVQGIPTGGQASIHLIARAAAQGLLCHGPEREGEPSYVLLQDWIRDASSYVPRALPRVAALDELARRYLEAYGPASAADLAAWLGLSLRDLRGALARIAAKLSEVEIAGRPAWLPKSHPARCLRLDWLDGLASPGRCLRLASKTPAPLVRLLPRFDIYLLGYAGREMIAATLLVGGCILGTWSTKKHRDPIEVIIEPFTRLAPEVRAALEPEVAGLGRFLGVKAVLSGTLA